MIDKFNMYKQLLSTGVTEHGCLFCDGCEPNIIRGSTVRHTFRLPFNSMMPETILITYKQNNIKVLEKKLVDVNVSIDNNLIYYDLSELDTLKFKEGITTSVQLRASFKDKRIINSKIFNLEVYTVIDDKLISNESINYYALEADVNAQKVEVRNDFNLVQSSNNLYKCKLLFDSTWNKFTKKVIFKDQYNHKVYTDVIEDDAGHCECLIPDILLEKPGWLNMGLVGSYITDTQNIVKPTMWSSSIKVPRSCLGVNEFSDLEFDNIYVYQGVVDDAYEFKVPQELEVQATTKKDLLNTKGYTWEGYWLDNQYHVLAIPDILNVECEKVIQEDVGGNRYTIYPTSHGSSESGNYKFYYFSSRATGTFTSTYYFKEVK